MFHRNHVRGIPQLYPVEVFALRLAEQPFHVGYQRCVDAAERRFGVHVKQFDELALAARPALRRSRAGWARAPQLGMFRFQLAHIFRRVFAVVTRELGVHLRGVESSEDFLQILAVSLFVGKEEVERQRPEVLKTRSVQEHVVDAAGSRYLPRIERPAEACRVVEHLLRRFDAAHVPFVERLVEARRPSEHAAHIPDAAGPPRIERLVEAGRLREHAGHILDLRRVP